MFFPLEFGPLSFRRAILPSPVIEEWRTPLHAVVIVFHHILQPQAGAGVFRLVLSPFQGLSQHRRLFTVHLRPWAMNFIKHIVIHAQIICPQYRMLTLSSYTNQNRPGFLAATSTRMGYSSLHCLRNFSTYPALQSHLPQILPPCCTAAAQQGQGASTTLQGPLDHLTYLVLFRTDRYRHHQKIQTVKRIWFHVPNNYVSTVTCILQSMCEATATSAKAGAVYANLAAGWY